MTTLREAALQAIEALENSCPEAANEDDFVGLVRLHYSAIKALRTALAEPEREPVAYVHRQGNHWEVSERFLCDDEKARGWTEEPLYTHPVDDTALLQQTLEALVAAGLSAHKTKQVRQKAISALRERLQGRA